MNDAGDPVPATGFPAPAREGVEPLLQVEALSKSYGPIRAVEALTLDVRAGEVHGICGHNGAGKSTLVKALVGLVRPDSGTIRFAGEEVQLRDPQDAQSRGIAIVNQELSLVAALSVEDNIYLGDADVPLLYRRREFRARARSVLDELGLERLSLGASVDSLAIGERQLVEIARLLVRDARLLILDEPTATLSKPEIERVFRATRDLVARGRAVIFVSHRLDEVFELCDRVSVLRDGRLVGTHSTGALDRRSLIALMLGEMEGGEAPPRAEQDAETLAASADVVEVSGLSVPGQLEDFSLTLQRGRIVGLAGQVGSGTSTLLRALGGLVPNASGGVRVLGREQRFSSPRHALDAGILYVSNDRQREGLFLGHRVDANLTVSRLKQISRLGILLRRRARAVARELATMVGVRFDRLSAPVSALSGGNQQKVLLGRGLRRDGTILLALDEPTRGVDVGGRADIHRLIREASSEGAAVIFSSTELDEVLDLADVIVTMFEGSVVSVVPRAQASAASVLADMTTRELRSGAAAG
jgi:ABC-type sugar transport system ATPase subunit